MLLVVSAEVFVLKPLLFEKIWRPWMLIPIVSITLFFLYNISKLILIVYIVILFFVNIICPYTFQKLNDKKCTISGPWDEALIEDPIDDAKEKKMS